MHVFYERIIAKKGNLRKLLETFQLKSKKNVLYRARNKNIVNKRCKIKQGHSLKKSMKQTAKILD